jgi:DNA-binding NarL/FixJ family response regulator
MQPRRPVVLVVDDSPPTLGLLNEVLERAGYTVLLAQSGAAALLSAERATPDLVLLDAVMPGLDGFETCRRMKRLPGLRGVPVVFMTGLTETEDVIRGLEAGGVDYVTKPLVADELVARIGVHLANARLTLSAHAALDAAGRYLLAVSRDGRVLWCTPQAEKLLAREGGARPAMLPEAAAAWLARCLAKPGTAPAGSLIAAGTAADRRVQFDYIGPSGPDEILLRLSATEGPGEDAILRARLGLTQREAEVLVWLSRGKSNRDIADILTLSPRTVNKHLEQMFQKLGVENRASATALALRTLQAP